MSSSAPLIKMLDELGDEPAHSVVMRFASYLVQADRHQSYHDPTATQALARVDTNKVVPFWGDSVLYNVAVGNLVLSADTSDYQRWVGNPKVVEAMRTVRDAFNSLATKEQVAYDRNAGKQIFTRLSQSYGL